MIVLFYLFKSINLHDSNTHNIQNIGISQMPFFLMPKLFNLSQLRFQNAEVRVEEYVEPNDQMEKVDELEEDQMTVNINKTSLKDSSLEELDVNFQIIKEVSPLVEDNALFTRITLPIFWIFNFSSSLFAIAGTASKAITDPVLPTQDDIGRV